MIEFLIFLFMCGGVSDYHTFWWTSSPGALGYTVYAGAPGDAWTEVSTVVGTEATLDFCTFPDFTLFLVTAFNACCESTTEHGDWAGEGYFPEDP